MGKEENAEKRKTFYWLGVFAYLSLPKNVLFKRI